MGKQDCVDKILKGKSPTPFHEKVEAYAPINIALIKYWGKRDLELNLPLTSSLSVTLDELGSTTTLSLNEERDVIYLNGRNLEPETAPFEQIKTFLDLFRTPEAPYFALMTENSVPTRAGLASSASGFAALVKAFNTFFDWQLSLSDQSLLARLGSGSACRSFWKGFVEWERGSLKDGMDSYGFPIEGSFQDLVIGVQIIEDREKKVSSRDGMQRTKDTSLLYGQWEKITHDLKKMMKTAITEQDFTLLGATAEQHALCLHATTLTSSPPLCYLEPKTLEAMQTIWQIREEENIPVYFTEDAGPNLKLLFPQQHQERIAQIFPSITCFKPFENLTPIEEEIAP